MTAYRRLRVPGGTYFFSVRLALPGSDALLRNIDVLRAAYADCLHHMPFETRAIVVLPDHLHAVWTLPPGDADFSARWRRIKARFSMQASGVPEYESVSRARRGERGIWQRRFWEHLIRDDADLDRHLRYSWTDPVRHGLVARAADWEHSSLHREIRRGAVDASRLSPEVAGAFGE